MSDREMKKWLALIAAGSFILMVLAVILKSNSGLLMIIVGFIAAVITVVDTVRRLIRYNKLEKHGVEGRAHIINLWQGRGRSKGSFAVTYEFHGRTMTDYISRKHYNDLEGKPSVKVLYVPGSPQICTVVDLEDETTAHKMGRTSGKMRKHTKSG